MARILLKALLCLSAPITITGKEGLPMRKIALAVVATAAVLTAVLIVTPAKAQIDMRTGLHLDDRDPASFYKHRGYGSNNATVGVGAGVTIGRPQDHGPAATLRLKRRAAKR
jgi:hypothetical protein